MALSFSIQLFRLAIERQYLVRYFHDIDDPAPGCHLFEVLGRRRHTKAPIYTTPYRDPPDRIRGKVSKEAIAFLKFVVFWHFAELGASDHGLGIGGLAWWLGLYIFNVGVNKFTGFHYRFYVMGWDETILFEMRIH